MTRTLTEAQTMNNMIELTIPEGFCRCPKCSGTTFIPLTEKEKTYSWNKGRDTRKCDNCGGQYQSCSPRGYVKKLPDGTGCSHLYVSAKVRNCLTEYTCKHCNEKYQIDSSD